MVQVQRGELTGCSDPLHLLVVVGGPQIWIGLDDDSTMRPGAAGAAREAGGVQRSTPFSGYHSHAKWLQLVRLETFVREAFIQKQHAVVIFWTWKKHMILHGNMVF